VNLHVPTSKWADFYRNRADDGYLAYVKDRYAPFIGSIRSRLRNGDLVLELGCGTAAITKALIDGSRPYSATFAASDIDPAMLEMARRRLADDDAVVFDCDALRPKIRADVVHSHGLLEHFDDGTIRDIIRANRSRAQVHYVPGLYPKPSFGDERLMSAAEWRRICRPDEIMTFNNGLDYALIFEARP
jgi:SAM-dependent methyltransferase